MIKEFSPDVKHLRYYIGQNWFDEWSVNFLIVLSDGVPEAKFSELARRIQFRIMDHLDYPNLGLFTDFSFRGESDQAKLKGADWEPPYSPTEFELPDVLR